MKLKFRMCIVSNRVSSYIYFGAHGRDTVIRERCMYIGDTVILQDTQNVTDYGQKTQNILCAL